MLKKIFAHSAIYGLAPLIPRLASIVVMPLLTAHLTELDFGVNGIILSYSGILGAFALLGLLTPLVNSYYHSPHGYKVFWRQLYGFLSLWSVLYGFILACLVYIIVPPEAYEHRILITALVALPIVCFGPVGAIGPWYYQLQRKPWQVAGRSMGAGLISLALNYYTIVVLHMGYMGWIWSNAITTFLLNISYWWVINYTAKLSPIWKFKWKTIKKALKVSLPMIPHYYAGYIIDSSDRAIMNMLKVPVDNIGRYNLAASFSSYMGVVAMAMSQGAAPFFNELLRAKKYIELRNQTLKLQALFFLGTFSGCLWLKEIFYLLIRNDALRDVYPLAIILIMAQNYRPMYFGTSSFIFYYEKTKNLWRISLGAGLIIVILNLILVPLFGYQAAVVSMFIGVSFMGFGWNVIREYRELIPVRFFSIWCLLLNIVLTIIVFLLRDLGICYKIIIFITLLLSVLFLARQILITYRKHYVDQKNLVENH